MDTLVIERRGIGGQAAVTQEIENYPGFPKGASGAELASLYQAQATRFGVEFLEAQVVKSIMGQGDYRLVTTESGQEYCASAILIATGSRYRRLGVPGAEQCIGAGVHFCATCDGPFYKGQDIVVVGGGNTGFQEGIFLTKFASHVTIVELAETPLASAILQEKAAGMSQIDVRTRTTIQEFKGDTKLRSVAVKDMGTNQVSDEAPAAVFVFIGMDPNTDFLKGTVDLDSRGFVVTGLDMETSLPGVFAAGDLRADAANQIASAVGEGATAALMIRRYLEQLGTKAKKAV